MQFSEKIIKTLQTNSIKNNVPVVSSKEENVEKEVNKLDTEVFSFADEMKDVKKIVQDKINTKKEIMDPKISAILKEMSEDEKHEEEIDFFSSANMIFVDPLDTISYKSSGLQYGVLRKLKSGEYTPQDGIDLHNHTIEQAYKKVRKFIVNSVKKNLRCVIIIHGKGEFSTPKALLKSYVAHWLKMMPEVIGYHTAMPYHGDKGSTYVLLKKGNDAREDTREQMARRR